MFCRRFLLIFFFLMLGQALFAQLCQGSLGDPIVNITFGSGGNPGPPLRAAATSYQYTSMDCPTDGSYTVRNRSDRCYTTWNALASDHTGDPNGYFMLVNASFDPGDFYVDTVELACSNTTYEFAAWVMNMNTPAECNNNTIRPNLTFIIAGTDGSPLQSFNTGDIQPANNASWQQFGFFFNLPPLVNRVVVKIRNNAPGGCGNDVALDDITFRPCGPKLTAALSDGSRELSLCQGTSRPVTMNGAISSGFDDPFLQWQLSNDDGSTWTNIAGANDATLVRNVQASTPAGTTKYRLTAVRRENRDAVACRVYSEVLAIKINERPAVSAATIPPLCEGGTLRLAATGGSTYIWTGSSGFSAIGETVVINNIDQSRAGRYYVTGTNTFGCQGRDSVDVLVRPAPKATVDKDNYTFCEGKTASLQAGGGVRYHWSPATGLSSSSISDPVAAPTDSTLYTVVVFNGQGCTDTTTVMINVLKKPTAEAGPLKEIGRGQSVVLSGTASGTGVTYSWSPAVAMDDPSKLQPRVAPTEDQLYFLTVESTVGCGVATDSVRVIVYKGVFVPTAFTPNGDGRNDRWRIFGLSVYASYEVLVFNRWGQVIYRSKNESPAWNGTFNGRPVPTGSYPYLIKIDGEEKVLKGLLNVIR